MIPVGLHSFLGAWKPAMVMKRRRSNSCVHNFCGRGSKSCLLGVCSKLNLQVQKARRALYPWFFLGYSRSTSFSTRFLVLSSSPPARTLPPSPSRSSPTKTPYDIPYAPPPRTPIRNDSACTYARSCFPVIYMLSIRHSSYRHSHSSTSPLEQTGSPSMFLFSLSLHPGIVTDGSV